MAFNTGNPIGSNDPRDLSDNAENMDRAINSNDPTFRDRLGRQRLTFAGMAEAAGDPALAIDAANRALGYANDAQHIANNVEMNAANIARDAAAEAVASVVDEIEGQVDVATGAADRAETAAAAAAQAGNIYPATSAGLAGTADGDYFTVPSAESAESLILYRNVSGSAVEQKRYPSGAMDSLTINRGKVYPLRRMTRNGAISAEPVAFTKAILNISIIGARAGKFYRLAYFLNGSTVLPGANPDGWIIQELDRANYETASGAVTAVIGASDAATPTIPRDGIQTVVLSSAAVPGLRVLITLDTAKLPAYGTEIRSSSAINPGYSYIIDPSRYIPAESSEVANSININSGQIAPYRNTSRGGVVSVPNVFQTDIILSARVINAKRGKYYGIRYFQNGNDAVVPAADGWIVEEVDIVGYDASVITPGNSISALADSQPMIDRSLGIQTVLINTKTDVRIEVVLDASKLQAYGTEYRMNSTPMRGYSQVLDPACYEFPVSSGGSGSRVSYSVDDNGRMTLGWSDGTGARGFVFGPNGANNLPNFVQVIKDGGVISSFSTDWLPPMVFDAVNNGDGSSLSFTGGNHLVNGQVTAESVAYIVEADGVPLTGASSGTADRVTCRIVNSLMAANTVSLGRYPLLQSFQVDFMPGVVGVHADIMALEDVDIYTDYACQIVTQGVNDTLFYLGGQFPAPIPFDGTVNSGAADAYPDAWAVLTSSANGQLGAWIDRDYGVAAENQIYAPYGKIIGGTTPGAKQYTTAINKKRVRSPGNAMRLEAGATYRWRGGYSWEPVIIPAGMVATLRYMDEWRVRSAFAVSAGRVLKP